MPNPENVEPHKFKPGQSGNPNGRPKGAVSLVKMIREKLVEVPPGQKKSYAEGLIDATLRDAIQKDGQSRKLCWEYVDGKAISRIAGAEGGPLQVEVEVTDEQSRNFARVALDAAAEDES